MQAPQLLEWDFEFKIEIDQEDKGEFSGELTQDVEAYQGSSFHSQSRIGTVGGMFQTDWTPCSTLS